MSHFPTSDELHAMLERSDTAAIQQAFAQAHPHVAAEVLQHWPDEELWAVLRSAKANDAAAAFGHLPFEHQLRLAAQREPQEVAQLLEHMPADDRTDLLKGLDEPVQHRLLALLADRQRLETERLIRYPEDTAGAVMSTEFAAVPSDMTVTEALALIRLEAPSKETIYHIYVMDEQTRLIGVLSLKDLILAGPWDRVADLMHTEVVSVRADEPRTLAAERVQAYDLLALPVVNGGGRLVGLVTVDDVLDVQQQEATSVFQKMASVRRVTKSPRDVGLWMLYRARAPWLLVLVFMNIFSGAGIAYFEKMIEATVALIFFLPLLIDSGGNAGSQSATLMIRALTVGDVRLRDWFSLLGKEALVSFALALTMAAAVMVVASFRAPEVLVPVGLTMICTVVFSSLVGMSLPFLLTKLKLDPATASSPLITTIADIGGVMIYFSIASWYLNPAGI